MIRTFKALAVTASMTDRAVTAAIDLLGRKTTRQFALYDLLRHEQALAATGQPAGRSEAARILDLVQMAYGDLVGLLVGRPDRILEAARDGEWTLRDLLRHAIAVEIRYAAQVQWAATRNDDDPLAIPDARLPCDRLSPPDPDFADSRTGGISRLLELLGEARRRADHLLAGVPDSALIRPSLWGQHEMTLRMRLHQTAAHLTEATLQAEKMLAPQGPASEARRIVRRCCRMRGLHERWSDPGARAALDARYEALAGPIGGSQAGEGNSGRPLPTHHLGAAAVVVGDSGEVLLVRHTYGRRNWEMPGGGSEPGESAEETARREVREETGLEIELGRFTGVYWEPGWNGVGMHHFVFRAHLPPGATPRVADPNEIAEVGWFRPDALPRPISDFTVRRIEDALLGRAAAFVTVGERAWRE